ncbi:MAG: sel1 repeat family protein [Bacteroidales bacterium]|nr:sel1 repeat family protein [Bacteroidales bacterium]
MIVCFVSLSATQIQAQEKGEALYKKACDLYDNQRYEEAYPLFNTLAGQGDVRASLELGHYYHEGLAPVEKDFSKAYACYKKAADKENVQALCRIGQMYEYGEYVQRDCNKAYDYYLKASKKGGRWAMQAKINIAWMLWQSGEEITIVKDERDMLDIAEDWFRRAAEEDNAHGNYCMAYFYDWCECVGASAHYFDQAASIHIDKRDAYIDSIYNVAASNGSVYAQSVVGFNLFLAHKYDEALTLLNKAKDNGATDVKRYYNVHIPIDLAIMICKHFKDNNTYKFYAVRDDDYGFGEWTIGVYPRSHYSGFPGIVTPVNDCILVVVEKNGKYGMIKLRSDGKLMAKTLIQYTEVPWYDPNTSQYISYLDGKRVPIDI